MKGNSERIPRKNMKTFCGRPLFHWIMDALSASKRIGEIIINTDSEEIARSASDHYAVTIHMRPDHLLTIDRNEAYQLMAHDLSLTAGDFFLQTHSTTPLVKMETIDRAIEAFFGQTACDSLMSVTPVQKRFFWGDGKPINHDPDRLIKTQELPVVLEENSCIYIFTRGVMEKRKNRIGANPLFFRMDPLESVDIDEMSDFIVAEAIMNHHQKEGTA